ncbi:MAG TPA: PfkB family carbohydrate kinase [Polyangiaceae bacterium]|nr:PfkB family carbohydrate kinase [Polyangiaceae bacterium]
MAGTTDTLLVVGSIAFDDIDLPSGEYRNVVGGSATYASLAASPFMRGGAVRMVGVVGSDFPRDTLVELERRGIGVTGIEHAAERTFRWHGRYSTDLASRTTIDTQLNVFASFSPKISALERNCTFVFLGNIHPELQVEVVEQVPRRKFIAADTMNFWIEREPSSLARMLRCVDLLIVNDEEARALSGIDNLVRAAADIRRRGPKTLVIKRGEFGALLFDEAGTFFAPGYPLEEVLDPTGAGDSFAGGLMGYLTSRGEATPWVVRKAMFFASSLGSFCVEGVGPARLLAIGHSEIAARIAAFARLVDYGGELHFSHS